MILINISEGVGIRTPFIAFNLVILEFSTVELKLINNVNIYLPFKIIIKHKFIIIGI